METTTSIRPGRLAMHETARIRAAAVHATRVHPGPVGQVLARELRAYADFGYRFGHDGLLDRLAVELLRAPAAPPLVPGPPVLFVCEPAA